MNNWRTTACNLIVNDLKPELSKAGLTIDKSPIPPQAIAELAQRMEDNILTHRQVKEIIEFVIENRRFIV